MECCGSLGLGHCCRQLCNLQVSLNLIEFCSCYSETYRNHTVAPHTLSQNSIFIIQWSGTTSWTCALSARPTRLRPPVRSALWLGECESHSENCFCLKIHSQILYQGGTRVDNLIISTVLKVLFIQSGATMLSTSTASPAGSRLARSSRLIQFELLTRIFIRFAPWTTATGSSRSMATRS